MIEVVETILCTCERCGHKWIPHTIPEDPYNPTFDEIPRVCPHCKSSYWTTKRRNKKSLEKP